MAVKTQILIWVKTPSSWVDTKILEEHAAPIFYPVDGGSMFLQNFENHLQDYTVIRPRRPQSKAVICFFPA